MATITMDTSEYEAMKKVEKLLEASVENERKLAEEIKKLNAEKIKALEDAKMKVVKISKIESKQYILAKLDLPMLYARFEDLRTLLNPSAFTYRTSMSGRGLDENRVKLIGALLEQCYKVEHKSELKEETVETFGLDEIKKEIREDLDKGLSAEVKRKMQIADNSFETITKLKQENRDLTANQSNLIIDLNKALEEQKKTANALEKEMLFSYEQSTVINTFISDFDKGIGYFEAKSYLAKFRTFVNSKLGK